MNAVGSESEPYGRDVLKETGLEVRVAKLTGVYASPNFIIEDTGGKRIQSIGLCFEAKPIGGVLCAAQETAAVGCFSLEQMKNIVVVEDGLVSGNETFAGSGAASIR